MDKIRKFSPIIKQKFGLVFGGHYNIIFNANDLTASLGRH